MKLNSLPDSVLYKIVQAIADRCIINARSTEAKKRLVLLGAAASKEEIFRLHSVLGIVQR
jgi:hypothetical protein